MWIASIVSAVLVAIGCALALWLGERYWWSTPVAYAPQLPLVLAPVIALVWALVVRSVPGVAFNALVLACALFGPVGLQVHRPRQPSGETFRIVTHNVLELGERADEFVTRPLVEADIVCLQEAGDPRFAGLLADREEAAVGDLRIFTRGRIVTTEVVRPTMDGVRSALACEIELNGRRLAVLNVHLSMAQPGRQPPLRRRIWPEYLAHTVDVRGGQFDAIRNWVERQELPVVVAGDFNTPPTSALIAGMRQRLVDCFAQVGWGLGHTWLLRGWPVLRIDYVWLGRRLRPLRCWTEGAYPSDHRPVVAEFEPGE